MIGDSRKPLQRLESGGGKMYSTTHSQCEGERLLVENLFQILETTSPVQEEMSTDVSEANAFGIHEPLTTVSKLLLEKILTRAYKHEDWP